MMESKSTRMVCPLASNNEALTGGTGQLADGAKTLASGADTLSNGTKLWQVEQRSWLPIMIH